MPLSLRLSHTHILETKKHVRNGIGLCETRNTHHIIHTVCRCEKDFGPVQIICDTL